VIVTGSRRRERGSSVVGRLMAYSAAVELAHIVVDVTLVHLLQGRDYALVEDPAEDLMEAFLEHGEFPLIFGPQGDPVAYNLWGYVRTRAEVLTR
jgi:hypothetical protein